MTHDISPWFWGLCGAFIYAGPRWVISLSTARDTKGSTILCTLEMFIALAVGPMAAAVFGELVNAVVLTTLHVKEDNAVYGLIGLFANRVAPEMVEKGSSALGSGVAIAARVLKALKGEEK